MTFIHDLARFKNTLLMSSFSSYNLGSHRFHEDELIAALGLRPGNEVNLDARERKLEARLYLAELPTT